MKLILICALLFPIVYLAFRHKKWYLFLLMAFVGILPEQFSVQLHENLPLISMTRVLIVVLFCFWIYNRWKSRRVSCPVSVLVFFVINVIISIVNLRYGLGEIKRIFLLTFERVLLIVMLMDTIESREEFDRCIDFMILGCCAVSVIGIIQTVLEYDIASVLHITETITSITLTPRMGLTRAYGTMNAISFGCYCAFMMLPIYYRIEKTGLLRYSAAFAVTFIALICTFSRSAWLAIGGIFAVLLLVQRGRLLRKILHSSMMIVVLCVALCIIQPKLGNAILETGKSSLNTVLAVLPDTAETPELTVKPSEDIDQNAGDLPILETGESSSNTVSDTLPETSDLPELTFELSEDFGLNGGDPSYSRMAQWTAVEYMIMDGEALFGYGYNAFPEGRIRVFYDRWLAQWEVATFLDVGLVALITESGFIGTISYLGLLAFIWLKAFQRRTKTAEFDFCKVTLYMIPLYFLLNFLASFLHANAVWLVWGMAYAHTRLQKE